MLIDNESQSLKQIIRSAFPTDVSLSHADCEVLRSSLVAIRDEDVLNLLGIVLIDLIETHRASPELEPDYADSVVRFLCGANAPPLGSAPGLVISGEAFNEMRSFSSTYKRSAERLFGTFTIAQSRAVVAWLEAASLWKHSNIPSEELDAALEYWNDKRNQPN
jgi:hypothetical protein